MILWRNFRDRATVIVLCCLLMMHGQANCGSSFFSWSFCPCKCSISSLVFIINNLKKSSSEGGKGLFVSEGTQLKSSRPDAAALLKSPPGADHCSSHGISLHGLLAHFQAIVPLLPGSWRKTVPSEKILSNFSGSCHLSIRNISVWHQIDSYLNTHSLTSTGTMFHQKKTHVPLKTHLPMLRQWNYNTEVFNR